MDAGHDQNFINKIVKIGCKTFVFFCTKYPIPICILFLFLVSYLFFPTVFTILIYGFPIAIFSFIVHKVLLNIDRQKSKRVEEDDRRRKFAKSRRSFKSTYGDRSKLIRRNTMKRRDDDTITSNEDKDDFFSKTLNDLLFEGKPKEIEEVDINSIVSKAIFSSSNHHSQPLRPKIVGNHKDELERKGLDDEPHDKALRWTEDDQKNVMDLGLSEPVERNKRLKGLMEKRKSRKNLGFKEGGEMENNNNVQVSAIKTSRVNPFLEDNSCVPGSAPSSFLTIHNPFDIPYDPHEEKPDLTGDNFHQEFEVGHQKEQIYSRHQSFSLGAFSHPEIIHDKHDMAFYKDLATKQKSVIGLGTSTIDEADDVPQRVSNAIESDSQKKADSTMLDERKADSVFFYGTNKRVSRAPSSCALSDLQVEVSDEGSTATLDEVDIEKAKESGLDSSNQSETEIEVIREGAEKIMSNLASTDGVFD